MEHSVEVVPATAGHVEQMAPHVRECDRREIWAQLHLEPREALMLSISEYGDETRACLLDGKVVAIFGVVNVSPDNDTRAGVLWMIGTDDIYDHVDLFHEHTAQWLEHYRSRFQYIANWVDSRNTAAVKWIESVGFEVHDPIPYGPDQVPFHYFEWRAA